ncbi:LuxE/PaaK family acyltransferase [Streptomyces silvisoli]|uniref:Acyl-protein synthetase LuxE domain-containing protein n=1 Tax=Streptomyces silvisoli TaxID=3034235 RepID=A0ABT5ZKC9_9ACTN|nr:hypothetical protein [Streptomyces silvisoli]MDF3290280.1 hypothetical protein [Streptomyces silvisoli]
MTGQASRPERELNILESVRELTTHHLANCLEYARISRALGFPAVSEISNLVDLPWLPVRLFKTHSLKSIRNEAVFKVLTSSGTTGQPSRIFLDRAAAAAHQRAMFESLRPVVGSSRLPMLIVDQRSTVSEGGSLSARAAGALGLMLLGRHHTFLMDEHGKTDTGALHSFLDQHADRPFLIFGFTYLVWTRLYEVARKEGVDLSEGVLLHSGGWKKMVDLAVNDDEFRRAFRAVGLERVYNFYGMVEQIGSIFVEGERTRQLYCPAHADVIIRDPETWQEAPVGRPGVIEIISALPRSYPGHVLLTEDMGVVHGIDDGDLPGKRFSVLGRLPRSAPRGCSDTFQEAVQS